MPLATASRVPATRAQTACFSAHQTFILIAAFIIMGPLRSSESLQHPAELSLRGTIKRPLAGTHRVKARRIAASPNRSNAAPARARPMRIHAIRTGAAIQNIKWRPDSAWRDRSVSALFSRARVQTTQTGDRLRKIRLKAYSGRSVRKCVHFLRQLNIQSR